MCAAWEQWIPTIQKVKVGDRDSPTYNETSARFFAYVFNYNQRNILKCDVNTFLIILYR